MSKPLPYPPIRLSLTLLPASGRRPTPDECAQIRAWGTPLRPRSSQHWLMVRTGHAEAKLLHKAKSSQCTYKIPLEPTYEKVAITSLTDAARAPIPMMF